MSGTSLSVVAASCLKTSTRQNESVINLNVEKYKCAKWQHAQYHCLKYVDVVFDVDITVPEMTI